MRKAEQEVCGAEFDEKLNQGVMPSRSDADVDAESGRASAWDSDPPLAAASPGAALDFRLRLTASRFAQPRTDSTDAPSVEFHGHARAVPPFIHPEIVAPACIVAPSVALLGLCERSICFRTPKCFVHS